MADGHVNEDDLLIRRLLNKQVYTILSGGHFKSILMYAAAIVVYLDNFLNYVRFQNFWPPR